MRLPGMPQVAWTRDEERAGGCSLSQRFVAARDEGAWGWAARAAGLVQLGAHSGGVPDSWKPRLRGCLCRGLENPR